MDADDVARAGRVTPRGGEMGTWVGRADDVRGGHGGDECLLVERWSKWVTGRQRGGGSSGMRVSWAMGLGRAEDAARRRG